MTAAGRLACAARLAVVAAALLAPGACGGGSEVPRDSFYRLDVPAPERSFAEPPLAGVVEVARLAGDGVVNDRAIAYSGEAGKLQQYSYHYWVESPTQLVQDALVAALRDSGAAGRAATPAMRLRPDYLVQGKLHRFEQVIEGEGARGIVALELSVTRARDGRLVLLETYRSEAAAADASVRAAVAALRRAVAEALGGLLADLAARGA